MSISNCCGTEMIDDIDLCPTCKEHCDAITTDLSHYIKELEKAQCHLFATDKNLHVSNKRFENCHTTADAIFAKSIYHNTLLQVIIDELEQITDV